MCTIAENNTETLVLQVRDKLIARQTNGGKQYVPN